MGFLRRFFSIGIKRNKKKRSRNDSDLNKPDIGRGLDRIQEEEQEAAVSRLLRSSSARFAVVSEVDYSSLPPMPHPINQVLQTPAASTTTLSSTGTTQRSTYTVTIHRRTRHALTEFPHANPSIPTHAESRSQTPSPSHEYTSPLSRLHDSISTRHRSKSTPFPMTPRDSNRLQRLRQDPSVASLLNMYDEHGCLPPNAFSNSPPSPPKERAQVRRNGSTLRQLLGGPAPRRNSSTDDSGLEGDISWAERFLGETDANSSTSSFGNCLETPTDFDAPLIHNRLDHKHERTTFPTEHDLSHVNDTDTSANCPAISSMEVEISISDSPPVSASCHPASPYKHENPMTPQRASQIFDFLTERRRSCLPQELPALPLHSAFEPPCVSRFSESSSDHDSSETEEKFMTKASPHDTHNDSPIRAPSFDFYPFQSQTQHCSTELRRGRLQRSLSGTRSRSNSLASHYDNNNDSSSCNFNAQHRNTPSLEYSDAEGQELRQVKVIITAPTPAGNHLGNQLPAEPVPHTRGPRGPRPRLSQPSTKLHNEDEAGHMNGYTRHDAPLGPYLANVNVAPVPPTQDPFTPMPSRRPKGHRRTTSHSSTSTLSLMSFSDFPDALIAEPSLTARAAEKQRQRGWAGAVIDVCEKENSIVADVSVDVLPVTPVRKHSRALFPFRPSPASSTELSPVGQQLMTNLRQQRMRAREAERQRERYGGRRR